MLIVVNLVLMRINNSYYMFNYLWTTIGGTAPFACKTPTNVILSVSLPEHIQFNEAFVSGNGNSKLEPNIHLPQTVTQLSVWCAVSSNKHTVG